MSRIDNNTTAPSSQPAVGKNITKLFLVFMLITFSVMLILSIFFLAPRIESMLTKQKIETAETTIRLHAENIRRYFSDRAILLTDITRFPAVVTSTMTLDGDNVALKEFLFNTSILGQQLPLALLDIDGEIIYSTNANQFVGHDSHFWADNLISGKENLYLELLKNEQGERFEIAVPVFFRGEAEGILVAIIPSEASQILTGKLDNSSFHIELKQGNTVFSSQRPLPTSSVLTRKLRLEELNLDLTYILDKAPLIKAVNKIRDQLLGILLIAILLALAIFLIFSYRTLVLPYKELTKLSTKLSDTSRELQLIFDNVPARIWYKDAHNRILRLNSQAAKSMGMTISEAEGQDTYTLFPDNAKSYHEDDLSVIKSGQPRLGIIEEYTPLDGEHGWVSTDKVPYTNPETGQSSVLVVSKDITELKTMQSALAESEERYVIAVAGSSVGLWDWNIVSNELYWSPHFMEILGIDEHDFVPELSSFSERLHPDDKERIMTVLTQHLETGSEYNVEYRLQHEKGHYVWIHARGQAIWDESGIATRCAGSVDDISSRKRDEEVLQQLYSLSNNPAISLEQKIISLLSLARTYLSCPSAGVSHITGDNYLIKYASGSDVNAGKNYSLSDTFCSVSLKKEKLFSFHDITKTEYLKHDAYHLQQYKSYISTPIYLNNTHWGTLFIADKKAHVAPYREPELAFINLVAQWIGNELSRDQDLRQLTDTQADLANSVDQLTKTNHELERFAYIASHDLQEPLRMINSFTGLLQARYSDKIDSDGQYYMETCTKSATRMQALINDLLEYARTNNNAQRYTMTDMNSIVEDTLDNLHESIKESNASIICEDLPTLSIDPPHTVRLLQNLVGNAIKYRADGKEPRISINSVERKQDWLFSIKDDGIGMKPEYLEKIFSPFKRLHAKEEYSGTGIGLSICQKIVEQRGGTIWANSAIGKGSTFSFTIPKEHVSNFQGEQQPITANTEPK